MQGRINFSSAILEMKKSDFEKNRVGSSMPAATVYFRKYTPEGIYCYSYFLLLPRKENRTETDVGKKTRTPMKSTMLISMPLQKSRGSLFPNNKSSLTFSLNFQAIPLESFSLK